VNPAPFDADAGRLEAGATPSRMLSDIALRVFNAGPDPDKEARSEERSP
jgi:hypothetical protein